MSFYMRLSFYDNSNVINQSAGWCEASGMTPTYSYR